MKVKKMENSENLTPKDIFALIDKQGNGFLSIDDMREVITKLQLEG